MRIYIGYNKRSFSTARSLRDFFKNMGNDCRIINNKRFRYRPDVFLRWGNSYKECPIGAIEINSMDAVRNASDKMLMANTLINSDEVRFPKAYASPLSLARMAEKQGVWVSEGFLPMENDMDLYYRNSSGVVRRRHFYIEGDLYGTEPIERSREFRVHIFNGKTIGVYEKIPHDEDQFYCKNDNCEFVRLDMSDESTRESLIGVRPMARAAVNSLGLVFGGVDVIISKSGEIFVNEVNSAPSLNSVNLDRYYSHIMSYIDSIQKEKDEN